MIQIKFSKIKIERSRRKLLVMPPSINVFDNILHPDRFLKFKNAAWESELFNELFGEINKKPPINPFSHIWNISI